MSEAKHTDVAAVIDYWGGCPNCGRHDGALNVRSTHWFVCHAHQVRWLVGANLFSHWREEDEVVWQANARLLEGYCNVKPLEAEAVSVVDEVASTKENRWGFEDFFGINFRARSMALAELNLAGKLEGWTAADFEDFLS